MKLNRRDFIVLSVAVVAGCKDQNSSESSGPAVNRKIIDAGPVSDYAADGVYSRFQDQGFFIIRSGERLVALSSICTHRDCRLNVEPDRSFKCRCHGSTFDTGGKVTHGPADEDLPNLTASTDPRAHLLVQVSQA